MHKLYLAIICVIIGVWPLYAALLRDVPTTVYQPDGTKLQCLATGDENHNWLHDSNNYTIIQNIETGEWTYAFKQAGKLYPSAYKAGDPVPASSGITPGLNFDPDYYRLKREARRNESDRDAFRSPTSGIINNLVVYIRFAGESEFTGSLTTYTTMFNNNTPNTNSMYNYFKENSYNALEISTAFYPDPVGTTIVSYQDTHPRNYFEPYSASNPEGYSGDNEFAQREHTLLRAALWFITPMLPSELDLDSDDDGEVDNVCFIIKGTTGAWADLLWPHMWYLETYDVYLNGAVVGPYNFQLEESLLDSGVGVLCHEMSHSMGFPDLYHYSYDGFSTVGRWDLMESDRNPPQHHSTYMKYRYGHWIDEITEITESGTYWVNKILNPEGNCYKIASNDPQYYYVVEFRKKTGTFENSLPGTGMLVFRVNTAMDGIGNADGPPDELYVYRLNGTATSNGQTNSAHFSSQVNRTAIGETTNPSAFLPNGNYGGLNIFGIGSSAGDSISFNIELPAIPPIDFDEGFESGNFSANAWTFEGNANWSITSNLPYMGSYCATSGAIANSQNSDLMLSLNVSSDGEIGFFKKVSSEANYDYLKFFIDDVQMAQWTGESSWSYAHFPVLAGMHTFKWRYAKDQGVVSGSDCAWIDNISFLWDSPDLFLPPLNLSATSASDDVAINLIWEAPNPSPAAVFTGYKLYRNDILLTVLPSSQTQITDYYVMPLNSYSYFLTATYSNPTGESAPSDTVIVEAGNNPIIPTLTAADIVDTFNVHLEWQIPVASRGITGYFIYRNGALLQSITDTGTMEYLDTNLVNGTYSYQIAAQYPAFVTDLSNAIAVTIDIDVDNIDTSMPAQGWGIITVYPNPFNPTANIFFSLDKETTLTDLCIYNIKGQKVKTLKSGLLKSGTYHLTWDATNVNNQKVASGIYYVIMKSGNLVSRNKILLIK